MMHGTVCALIQYIVIIVKYIGFEFEGKKAYFSFPTMKGSMNACMELVGFSTSNKVKNHWSRIIDRLGECLFSTYDMVLRMYVIPYFRTY